MAALTVEGNSLNCYGKSPNFTVSGLLPSSHQYEQIPIAKPRNKVNVEVEEYDNVEDDMEAVHASLLPEEKNKLESDISDTCHSTTETQSMDPIESNGKIKKSSKIRLFSRKNKKRDSVTSSEEKEIEVKSTTKKTGKITKKVSKANNRKGHDNSSVKASVNDSQLNDSSCILAADDSGSVASERLSHSLHNTAMSTACDSSSVVKISSVETSTAAQQSVNASSQPAVVEEYVTPQAHYMKMKTDDVKQDDSDDQTDKSQSSFGRVSYWTCCAGPSTTSKQKSKKAKEEKHKENKSKKCGKNKNKMDSRELPVGFMCNGDGGSIVPDIPDRSSLSLTKPATEVITDDSQNYKQAVSACSDDVQQAEMVDPKRVIMTVPPANHQVTVNSNISGNGGISLLRNPQSSSNSQAPQPAPRTNFPSIYVPTITYPSLVARPHFEESSATDGGGGVSADSSQTKQSSYSSQYRETLVSEPDLSKKPVRSALKGSKDKQIFSKQLESKLQERMSLADTSQRSSIASNSANSAQATGWNTATCVGPVKLNKGGELPTSPVTGGVQVMMMDPRRLTNIMSPPTMASLPATSAVENNNDDNDDDDDDDDIPDYDNLCGDDSSDDEVEYTDQQRNLEAKVVRNDSLAKFLNSRRQRNEMYDRSIIPQRSEAEKQEIRDKIGSQLSRRLSQRPTAQELAEKHILLTQSPEEMRRERDELKRTLLRKLSFRPTVTELKERRIIKFNDYVEVTDVEEYDRRGDKPWMRLTPRDKAAIRKELNEFKSLEMEVHDESRQYTRFHQP